jgi:two-component system, NtrC family, sensor histidine kinase PilS
MQAILDPRRLVRWVYVGRLSLASAIYLAALLVWTDAQSTDTLIASLAFAGAMVFTVASAMYTEVYAGTTNQTFLYLQTLFDLLLVTAVVHVTGGSASQFAALYILVIVSASLMLPIGGGLLIAALGNVMYFADVILGHQTVLEVGVWLQLGVFGIVALGSGYLSARMQEAGAGKEELAAELVQVRLQAADILRNIRSGVLTLDAQGRLLYANPSASTLLGLELQPHLGRPVVELIAGVAPELASALERTIRDRVRTARAEGEIVTGETRFPIGVTTTYVEDPERGDRAVTAIFQNISDQKRLDDLHLRAERLEAVAELSASLAHEIRNPLASIRSAVEQLALKPKANADEKVLGTLIVREADRLSRLLSEFLDFARVRVTRIERVDVGEVARGVAKLVSAHPDRHEGVKITCAVPSDPFIVEGDLDLLHRALFNLTLNAVQAPARRNVFMEVMPVSEEHLPVGVRFERGGAVAVRVTDDGPGIALDIRDRLFDPFFTTKPGGTGLGLAVVHRAIEAHRGLVFVDSDTEGTRFTVLLPRTQSEVDEAP